MEFGVAQSGDERSVDEGVDIRQNLLHALVREDFLIRESGIAPDVLASFLLDPAGEFREAFDLI